MKLLEINVYYCYLFLAIGAEIAATSFLKLSKGMTSIFYAVCCAGAYLICYFFFSKALLKINLGIAYATWCGIGILATTFLSAFLFHEKISYAGMAGTIFIVAGCLLVNLK